MDINLTFTGNAVTIEPGKTYAIEVDKGMSPDIAQQYSKILKEDTGANFVFLFGGKLAKTTEEELREQIAKDIEFGIDARDNDEWRWATRYAAAIARGKDE